MKELIDSKEMFSVHLHTDISNIKLRDSTNKVEDVLDYALKLGLPGIAITDHSSIGNHIKATRYIEDNPDKFKDFTLGLGEEFYLCERDEIERAVENNERVKYPHFLVLAKNQKGYEFLKKLSTREWENSFWHRGMQRTPTYYEDLIELTKGYEDDIIFSSACFTKGQKVETIDGFKNIENIKVGDTVKTEDGSYQKVITPTNRYFNGDFISLDVANSILPIESTDNHKFLTIPNKHWVGNCNINVEHYEKIKETMGYYKTDKTRSEKNGINQRAKQRSSIISPKWKQAKDLSVSDYILTPIDYSINNLDTLTLSNTTYKINNDFLYVLGVFIGDGYFRTNDDYYIGFTLNYKDTDKVLFIKEYFSSLGLNVTIKTREKHSRTDIIVYGKDNTLFWKELFNYKFGAINKHIPEPLKQLPLKKLQYILKGLAHSDGYFRKGNRNEFIYASISYELIQDIKNVLFKFNINPIITFSKGRIDKNGVNHRDAWYLSFGANKSYKFKQFCDGVLDDFKLNDSDLSINDVPVYDGKTYFMKNRIKKITKINKKEKVYCMTVENNHSFILHGATVHNCLGSPLSQMILDYHYNRTKENQKRIHEFITFFINIVGKDDFYLELQPAIKHDGSNKEIKQEQQIVNDMLLKLSEAYGLKCIVTTDAHYLNKEQAFAHETYLKASNGEREVQEFYSTTYIMDREELLEYFDEELLDELIANTHEIMNKIEPITFENTTQVPTIDIPEYQNNNLFDEYLDDYEYIKKYKYSKEPMDNYYLHLLGEGMKYYSQEFNKENLSRINTELEQIWEISVKLKQPLSSYFVLTKDIVDMMWTVSLVGTARGSASCYYTNYLLGIVQFNPIEYNLPYYRFLSKERASLPD